MAVWWLICQPMIFLMGRCLLQLKKGLADHLPEVRIMHLTEVLAKSMEA